MPGRGGTGHSMLVIEVINDMHNNNINPYVFYLDLSKAFDYISRKMIYHNLRKAGIPRNLVDLIAYQHKNTKICYRVDGSKSDYIDTIHGVPQGDPLSPIIFNLVINPMLDTLEDAHICHKFVTSESETDETLCMYTDDFLCICDSKKKMQEAINMC